ncbi:MAG: hypothetical protein WCO86_12995, partial [Planctomycetota bacterium]
KYTRALDTTGGYPATYSMTAGSEYWVSVIQVAGTPTSILCAADRQTSAANSATGAHLYLQGSQSDLVVTSSGTVNSISNGIYAEVS